MVNDELTTFVDLPESNQILVLAQLLYGYGYVGPFALEYEKTAIDCGLFDYEQVIYGVKVNMFEDNFIRV